MSRTLVILKHTFREAVVQPIYPLLLALGAAVVCIFGLLPFFTLSEDTVMFKSVALDVMLLLVLISTLFATSKSIFEEIEDRTMLTLMSKPVKKWEVLVGKYLGIVLAAGLAAAVLGSVLLVATWWRIPTDYMIRGASLDDREYRYLLGLRVMHIAGLVPSIVLSWLQISVLAAVGVAVSTRVPLVVNLPVVIFVYIAGNLTRFLFPLDGQSFIMKAFAVVVGTVMPYLEIFDLSKVTVHARISLPQFPQLGLDPSAVPLGSIWLYVGLAFCYATVYSFFALTAGMWLFHNRELGGAEG